MPGSATRFGSARLLKSPLVVSARIRTSRLEFGLNRPKSMAPWSGLPSIVPWVAPRQSPLSLSLCGLSVRVWALKLLDHVPVHFGEADLEQHLDRVRRAQVVDDRGPAALGDLHRPVGRAGVAHLARERDRVAGRGHVDLLVRQQLAQVALQARRVGRHLDRVEPRRVGVVPQHQRRGAERLAVHQHFGGRDHHGLGDRRVAHREALQRRLGDHQDRRALGDGDDLLRLADDALRLGERGNEGDQGYQRHGGDTVTDPSERCHGTPGVWGRQGGRRHQNLSSVRTPPL